MFEILEERRCPAASQNNRWVLQRMTWGGVGETIRILIVDDSALVRQTLTAMRLQPMPVVMVSSLTERGADVSLEALEIGVVDFVTKSRLGTAEGLEEHAREICTKVGLPRALASRPKCGGAGGHALEAASEHARDERVCHRHRRVYRRHGGDRQHPGLLSALPPDVPPVVIAQHIPEVFGQRFARRLEEGSAIRVREAKDGDLLVLGTACVAPGNYHLGVVRSGAKYHCTVTQGERVNGTGLRSTCCSDRWRRPQRRTPSARCAPAWATTAPRG